MLVAWDTLTVPTYRHEALAAYQSGRVFDADLLEQLDLAPQLVEAMGFAAAKEDGYEADDFLAAGVAFEEARGGTALVASGDRDTFQLASERTTILQPQKGGGALARIGPAEVRERYGVDPEQVPDFIALRGDPSDKIPGARGVGAKTAASLLAQYGSLEAALAEGRFSAEADALRLYRHVATMDKEAPLPPLEDQEPTWARAAALADEWGLGQARGPAGGAVELLTNPALARLHPTGDHPERQDRLLGLGGETVERYADEEQLARVHTSDHLELLRVDRPAGAARRRTRSRRRPAGRPRGSRRASRSRRSTAAASRSSGRPAITRSPTGRWASASSTTSRSRLATRRRSSGSAASRSSTSTCTTATAPTRSSAATTRSCSSSIHQ